LDFSGKNILVKESIDFVKVEHDIELGRKISESYAFAEFF
jgi:hypothetical protein